MENQIKELKELIDRAEKILVTSHISPDPDALSSVLLLGTTLKHNYPVKDVVMALEEEPEGLDFLADYNGIKFGPLLETIKGAKPDLFVMLDAVNYERCSRTGGEQVRQYLADNKVKTAIIDHHEPAGKDGTDVYIHQGSPAAVQDVYEVLFDRMKLKKPTGYGETTMLGIYSDTSAFKYLNDRHKATFKIVSELIDAGVRIEELFYKLNQYTEEQMRAIAALSKNVTHQDDYTYSFVSDEFVTEWKNEGKSAESLHRARELFINNYIRNIEGRLWGFVVCKDSTLDDDSYSVSLRSVRGAKDVSILANILGGGGHKPAAGAKIQAKNLQEALTKVKQAITSS